MGIGQGFRALPAFCMRIEPQADGKATWPGHQKSSSPGGGGTYRYSYGRSFDPDAPNEGVRFIIWAVCQQRHFDPLIGALSNPIGRSAKFPEWDLLKLEQSNEKQQILVGGQSEPKPDHVVTMTT